MESKDDVNFEQLKYMEQFLYKKEANSKWIEYWVICRGSYLLFYSHRCEMTELRDAFRGFIELTPGTRCLIGKRKKYSFPFYLATSKSKYYFKTATLLLRHQWIHAIDLSLQGRYPETPPTTLPSPGAPRKQEIIEEDSSSSDVNISVDSTSNENPEMEIDADVHTTDLPKNIIMVTSRPQDEVTNFTGENVSPDARNYRVTNFLSARADGCNNNGVVNLSFEEDTVGITRNETATQNLTKKNDVQRSPKSQYPVIKTPVYSGLSPSYHRADKWLNRVTRSADSNRGSTYNLLGPAEKSSNSFLNIKPAANVSVNTSRFSRHLVCSAPDLQALTVENL